MRKLLLLMLMFSVMAMSASAVTWTGGGAPDPNWSNVANWDTGIPTATDDTVMGAGADGWIRDAYAAVANKLTLNDGAKISLELESTFVGTSNTYLNSGSTLHTYGFFRQATVISTGNSQIIVEPEALLIYNNNWWKNDAGADMTVLGGEVRIATGGTNVSYYGNDAWCDVAQGSIIDVHDGVITMRTHPTTPTVYLAEIQAKIDEGSIIGFGGAGTAQVTYTWDDSPWKPWGWGATIISATPEPATLAILGLGGLFLRKRRS